MEYLHTLVPAVLAVAVAVLAVAVAVAVPVAVAVAVAVVLVIWWTMKVSKVVIFTQPFLKQYLAFLQAILIYFCVAH